MTDQDAMCEEVNLDLVVAADLGGTHLRVAAVDQTGRIHFRFKQNTPHGQSADEIARAIISAARECESQTAAVGSIRAIAVAVPGTVDASKGLVVRTPNVPCLDGFSLGAVLESELKCPVILENDANAAAMGEMWLGAARDDRSIICVTLGTGVGGGIILDGKVWRGANGSAGEIGHMSLDPFAGAPCPCGGRGCLEVYTSATAIVRMTREELPRYPSSSLQPGDELSAEKIYQAGIAGDELALEIFRRMGAYLGIGLANLVNILNPEIIVVGGGVVNGWELFEKHMHQKVTERSFPSPITGVKIVPAECGDDAGLLGAAHLALQRGAPRLL
jgi:glucokinase